ncbi:MULTISPECIES: LysR family transcriptional regulator [Pseudomonas]|uniref:LysR family transcriptional regulator n=1 Tax=Pseudomonas TaxID=286 RepID=UPI0007B34063|nr:MULTISPECIES: LysR family transcriptional regulator [Pseudomonas]AZC50588.1 Transcriptional regulator, LysR family [Pseudomonas chlororaphis subsp. piscium]AZC57166.1 Transcriptional regulator, LysR family [Pseudomonas chlororaphis subsp. piscium]AZC63380.1 Transcriptional regulator, LysR family [Pseudomonas chlororaphis subsp. piscium]AZC69619.1 Transcriptional regulator, LysR family [Pseudomonas chlororaphis subsp. piscium]AZC75798.1 Transcriptional regulator, LysR family [Pseudomonas chl
MDLNAARMFVSVVQCGSISSAANLLQLPLATIRRGIRELERSLNVQLLERSARGTRLTAAGSQLYEHASRGIEALAEGEQAVRSDRMHLQGRLSVSVPAAFESWWKLLAEFQRRHPEVQVAVYTSERESDLAEDGVDVALRAGPLFDEDRPARLLGSYRHMLVASPQLLERLGTPQTPAELRGFPCAVWSRHADAREQWQLGDQSYSPNPLFAANDYLHLRQLALTAKVVTELPAFLAAEALRDGRLRALLPRLPMPEQQLYLLYPNQRPTSNIVRAYLDFAQAWLVENPLPQPH